MRLIFHIGYPKTATSWLQDYVFSSQSDITYLNIYDSMCSWLIEMIRQEELEYDLGAWRKRYSELEEKIGSECLLISWEGFVGDMFRGSADLRAASRLHAVCHDARIIITIRNQVDIANSIYGQFVKSGGWATEECFFGFEESMKTEFDLDFLKYDVLIDYYYSLFGSDNVYVCLYEKFCIEPERFLKAMHEFLGGTEFRLGDVNLGYHENRGLTKLSVKVARVANRFVGSEFNLSPMLPSKFITAKETRRFVQNGLDPRLRRFLGCSNYCLKESTRERLNVYYGLSNRRLVSMLNTSLDKIGYFIS